MLRKSLILTCLSALLTFPAFAAPEFVKGRINDALEVGSSRFTYMLWDVYDISLYATDGTWNENQPFALSLSYLRKLDGEEIAKRSIKEIRQLGFSDEIRLAAWFSEMKRVFPNVNKNTILTGIHKPNAPTLFLKNGEPIGTIKDPEFGTWFFNIWLSPNTSQPALRRKLLGLE